ncbi:putative transcription factor [Wickerhamomyces ciferrii]|uniref:Transcription factor n=1 Tax=Wickerhamomyces ciferrii (strain ATCC 14091 / BCRC 22168 / CBS 111 / JCM 3599 / NBRC 0793 / NRRL Y-1031 F-60-10) TaxID=1206466 RepID=K0KQ72_WICCF|nr:putative transcription factor [Wickerhamomyces ciferrii]CCH45196.1 putative transcription factor [Wickerhamomyces ciferrii]
MSDNFTDTNKYATSLNLGRSNSQDNTSRSNSIGGIPVNQFNNGAEVHQGFNNQHQAQTRNYPPIQPSPGLPSLAPLRPLAQAPPHHQRSASPQPIQPNQQQQQPSPKPNTTSTASAPKKRANNSNETKSRKKQNSQDEKNKLNTLANLAVSPTPDASQPGNSKTQSTSQSNSQAHQPAGHRPVTSCTHCRQHKIKCNASERFPAPCQRCEKMGLTCEIDPQFRPKKGSQIQSLRNDVDELKLKIEYLQRNESLIAQALANQQQVSNFPRNEHAPSVSSPLNSMSGDSPPSGSTSLKTILKRDPHLLVDRRNSQPGSIQSNSPSSAQQLLNDSAPTNSDHSKDLPPFLEMSVRANTPVPEDHIASPHSQRSTASSNITEFILGDVNIPLKKANELHERFMQVYNPFFPIMHSNNASELYSQSQLLFWVVCLTACSSDPEPTLYNQLSSLIKQLAIETCWIRTPRSTHIAQALLILCMWPLPNQKVLDDCSYRFVGLAKSLGYQLGLHRGKFISEFSRTQVALPDAEKWRTRSWLGIFFAEQFWASQLGLPPSLQTDYLIENARIDKNLPKNFRSLISLSIFQAKLVNVMGSSVTSPDGLMEARNRAGSLAILERELERLVFKLEIDDIWVEIYYLYVKLTICCFAFLPETPTEDQTKYVTQAYLSATRIITNVSKILETKALIELPIYIRQSVSYSAFILFKLHLTPLLLEKYIDSARQSIVTVHRLFRNQLSAWKDVENDISRTAQVLEKLNFVLYTHPELYTKNDGIITRMRSHLTGSLFYDLVWCIHEARRRTLEEQKNGKTPTRPQIQQQQQQDGDRKKPIPLPFYNQINRDDFQTITTTTPGGTTITTLVPTENAMTTATANATAAGLSKPKDIKGIPVNMLDSTGSIAASALGNSNIASLNNSSSNLQDLRRVVQKNNANVLNNNNNSTNNISSLLTNDSNSILNNGNQSPNRFRDSQSPNGATPTANSNQYPVNFDFSGVQNVPSPSNPNFGNGFDINNPSNSNEGITKEDFNSFFQQQSAGWMEGNDDVLGWFDMNMAPEF